MGIAGLWLGFTIACIILDIGFAMIISCPDWRKISEQARAEIKEKGDICRTPEVRNLRRNMTPSQKKPTLYEGGHFDSLNLKPSFSAAVNDEILEKQALTRQKVYIH